jgi:hypothetical protein
MERGACCSKINIRPVLRNRNTYAQHRSGAAANPEQFVPPRELLDMVSGLEHLLRTGEGVFGSGKPTYSLTTIMIY